VQSSSQAKYWNNPHGWAQVVDFLKQRGFRIICIDQKKTHGSGLVWTHIPHGVEDETGDRPLAERARWLRHASAFIGLSSGLSWLAWAAGAPVAMISGFTHPTNEFDTPYRVINYHACNSCWNDVRCRFDHKDFMWCPRHAGTPRQFECTRLITAEQVIQTCVKFPIWRKPTSPPRRGSTPSSRKAGTPPDDNHVPSGYGLYNTLINNSGGGPGDSNWVVDSGAEMLNVGFVSGASVFVSSGASPVADIYVFSGGGANVLPGAVVSNLYVSGGGVAFISGGSNNGMFSAGTVNGLFVSSGRRGGQLGRTYFRRSHNERRRRHRRRRHGRWSEHFFARVGGRQFDIVILWPVLQRSCLEWRRASRRRRQRVGGHCRRQRRH
jgi:hypothetical protein